MIARLSGILAEVSADSAVIDVGGVGYQIHASGRTLDAIGPIGGEVLILTELHVREDSPAARGEALVAMRDAVRAALGRSG